MPIEHIIFDLDGTLIDSSPSILDAFANAFAVCGHTPVRPLTADVIGPPLMATLAMLSGSSDPSLLDALATAFKERYDREGHFSTLVFPGVDAMLGALTEDGYDLSIATNKRLVPTRNILAHLNWLPYFSSVNALDSFSPPLASKSVMLSRVLCDHCINPASAIYIGDRDEDGIAAHENHLGFIFAAWGYGASTPATGSNGAGMQAGTPTDIPDLITKANC